MTISHTQFFGDQERTFMLAVPQIVELERQTGTGVGALAQRIMRREFALNELHQIIRLGLIGGGTDPKEATDLMAAYVYPRPIEEAQLIAINVISAAYFGTPNEGAA
ncbi:gene transfer agent family protein [Aureimonas altamirensis]|uniref:gene transfer agent family protein n=1 Tax=Aureimonas altamirensis TaxID=370622 RepID=UPI0020374B8B|nr:gene transfer agent family protein [Aureimonas altamirensis]MCM2504087.1 gene transfer agent family protein [Aureimonas altamirensis]